jgi:hypothetical protein
MIVLAIGLLGALVTASLGLAARRHRARLREAARVADRLERLVAPTGRAPTHDPRTLDAS